MPYHTHRTTPSHEAAKLSAFLCGVLFFLGFVVVWTAATTPPTTSAFATMQPCR